MSANIVSENNLIQDFIDATTEALGTMASVDVGIKNIREINSNIDCMDITSCMDITGILGFSGGRKGSILVTFPSRLALNVIGGMLGIVFDEIDADVRDGIGEIVNVIAGGAKTKLQEKDVHFELSIPNTVIGTDHQITAPPSTSRTRVEFVVDNDEFFIEVYIKQG